MRNSRVSFFEGKRVWVVGHSDPIGSAIVDRLWREPCEIVLTARSQLDLLRQADVEDWMRRQRPDVVFLTDHRDNTRDPQSSASDLHRSLMVNCNILATAHEIDVGTLVNVSLHQCGCGPTLDAILYNTVACAKEASQSLARSIASRLTNAYSCQYGRRFVALVAENAYGRDKKFGSGTTLSVASLVQRLAIAALRGAPQITLPKDDGFHYGLVHVDDLADAAVFLAETYRGKDLVRHAPEQTTSLRELAKLIGEIVGFRGKLILSDKSIGRRIDPGGPQFRRLNTLGWQPKVDLRKGVRGVHSTWLKLVEEHALAKH